MSKYLPYDPGPLPSFPAPEAGDTIIIRVEELPPYKDEHFSIRNPKHKIYNRFIVLRKAAIEAMSGRAPYRGPVQLDLIMHAPDFEKSRSISDYVGGIADTLDGSHGTQFTYLPIVYEDDCQIVGFGQCRFMRDTVVWYEIKITFLIDNQDTI
jgi:hypothetical protein